MVLFFYPVQLQYFMLIPSASIDYCNSSLFQSQLLDRNDFIS